MNSTNGLAGHQPSNIPEDHGTVEPESFTGTRILERWPAVRQTWGTNSQVLTRNRVCVTRYIAFAVPTTCYSFSYIKTHASEYGRLKSLWWSTKSKSFWYCSSFVECYDVMGFSFFFKPITFFPNLDVSPPVTQQNSKTSTTDGW